MKKVKKKFKKIICVLLSVFFILSMSLISVSARSSISPASYQLYSPFSSYCISEHISESDLPLPRWSDCVFVDEGRSTGVIVKQAKLYNEMMNLKAKYDVTLSGVCDNINKMEDKEAEYFTGILSEQRKDIQNILNEGARMLIGIDVFAPTTLEKFKIYAEKTDDILNKISDYKELQNSLVSTSNEKAKVTNSSNSAFVNFMNTIIDGLNNMWVSLGNTITGTTSTTTGELEINFAGNNLSTSFSSFVSTATSITKVFGYSIAVICFGIGLMNEATAFELSTERGWFRVLGRLLLAKIWVDLSVTICKATFEVIQSIASQLIHLTTVSGFLKPLTVPASSNIFSEILMWISDLVSVLLSFIPLAAVSILIMVCICRIYIKLIVRNFELTCLLSVSPLFFATLSSNATSHYFRKFISSFLSVSAQTLWIGITYALTNNIVHDITSHTVSVGLLSSWSYLWTLILVTIVLFSASNMINKPSQELTGLLSG